MPDQPNGDISQYVIRVTPVDNDTSNSRNHSEGGSDFRQQSSWTVTVSPRSPVSSQFGGIEPGESAETSNTLLEAIVDNLLGGETYRFSVVAVNDAGPGGEVLAPSTEFEMPVLGILPYHNKFKLPI